MENKTKRTRKSSIKKTEIVLELLRGASIEELSRKNKVAVHELTNWRETFIQHGSSGFKKKPQDTMRHELERLIGRQQLEIELLKKKKTVYGRAKSIL